MGLKLNYNKRWPLKLHYNKSWALNQHYYERWALKLHYNKRWALKLHYNKRWTLKPLSYITYHAQLLCTGPLSWQCWKPMPILMSPFLYTKAILRVPTGISGISRYSYPTQAKVALGLPPSILHFLSLKIFFFTNCLIV